MLAQLSGQEQQQITAEPNLTETTVAELKAQGLAVLCWTIRSPEAEAKARRMAQNITFEGYAAPFPA